MLGGALALNTYTGIWRDTKDLDVFVSEKTVPRVLVVLEETGFETEVTEPVWLAKASRGELFADVIHASHNGTGPVGESWFENAREISILDRRALVIPAEELILSRIFVVAKDRCDVDDVLHVIFATRGEVRRVYTPAQLPADRGPESAGSRRSSPVTEAMRWVPRSTGKEDLEKRTL